MSKMPTKKIIIIPSIAVPVKCQFIGSPNNSCSKMTTIPSKKDIDEMNIPKLANRYKGFGEDEIIAEKAKLISFLFE